MPKSIARRFLREARRRRVFRVTGLYVVGAWIVLQVADLALPALGIPESSIRFVWVGLTIGFPISLILGWRYDIKNGLIVRTKNASDEVNLSLQSADYAILATLTIVAVAVVIGTVGGISQTQQYDERFNIGRNIDDLSIAVLPFINRSLDSGNEFFADGISEELLNALANVPKLRVVSRTSSFSFKNKDMSVREIATKLNVAYILEGSVRRSKSTIRITAQLIDARADSYLWSDAFDLTIDDIFAVQDEIAMAVADKLKMTLIGDLSIIKTTDSEAYVLYLQANHVSQRQSDETIQEAELLYRESLARDPTYSQSWIGLCRLYSNSVSMGVYPAEDGFRNAVDACQEALKHDPGSAAAFAELGWLASQVDDSLENAAQYIQRAWELDSTDAVVVSATASMMLELGRLKEAIALREQIVAVDPVNPVSYYNLGSAYLYNGDFADARLHYLKSLDLSPDFLGGWYALGLAELMMGRSESALERFALEADDAWRHKGRALAHHSLGNHDQATAALNEVISEIGEDWPSEVAKVYSFWNDADNAFKWLAREWQDPGGWAEGRLDPLYDNIESDPRWQKLLTQLGVSDDQLSLIVFEATMPHH